MMLHRPSPFSRVSVEYCPKMQEVITSVLGRTEVAKPLCIQREVAVAMARLPIAQRD